MKKSYQVIAIYLTVSLIIFIISYGIIRKVAKEKIYEKQCNEVYSGLFVTERNQVFDFYQAIGDAIESEKLDENCYKKLLEMAITTETVCIQTSVKSSDTFFTYRHSIYYTTFYRDIKLMLERKCSLDDLQSIYTVFGKILCLYDDHPQNLTPSEKRKAVVEFYQSVLLLDDDLVKFFRTKLLDLQ